MTRREAVIRVLRFDAALLLLVAGWLLLLGLSDFGRPPLWLGVWLLIMAALLET